ncbi:MAG: DUF4743 domain-containing protein [Rhodospirillales bacterium]|nr:DUF4743 domain-containing protein [Rhodospirillales bacterium]
MSYMDHIIACNRHDLVPFKPFRVEGVTIGHVRPAIAAEMLNHPEVFMASEGGLTFTDTLSGFERRSQAMARVVADLVENGFLPSVRGELYPAAASFSEDPFFQLDRGAIAAFGIRAFGVHVNGFVQHPDGAIDMWIARRAEDRMAYPGMLDNMVAGGQPVGLGLIENVIKECAEEADIPANLAVQARPTGAISYIHEATDGLKPDIMFCYDLALPEDFVPRNTDGEVAAFYRLPLGEVAALVECSFEFKFNCNLVIIDFLIRHGVLPPEHPDYLKLIQGLRQ